MPGQAFGQLSGGGEEFRGGRVKALVEAVGVRPLGGVPFGIPAHFPGRGHAQLPLQGGQDDEGADSDGELAEFDGRRFGRQAVVGGGGNPHAPANGLALYGDNDRLGAGPHRKDEAGETHEEFVGGLGVAYGQQFV